VNERIEDGGRIRLSAANEVKKTFDPDQSAAVAENGSFICLELDRISDHLAAGCLFSCGGLMFQTRQLIVICVTVYAQNYGRHGMKSPF
jgi:hypothetical protein